jgi:hypothetical protein
MGGGLIHIPNHFHIFGMRFYTSKLFFMALDNDHAMARKIPRVRAYNMDLYGTTKGRKSANPCRQWFTAISVLFAIVSW